MLTIAVLVLILALLLGGIGLAVEALRWMLIIAVIFLLASAITGWLGRTRNRSTGAPDEPSV
jgi:multisubunit Na+/H+ antiporter MnhG subunit